MHRTVLWSPGTRATTTHGSANLWDTQDKMQLKTAAKTIFFIYQKLAIREYITSSL